MLPAYAGPPGWAPPPSAPLPAPEPRASAQSGGQESPAPPFHSRTPCRMLPALPPEIVASYTR